MGPNITHSLYILVTVYIELHKCLAEIAAILAAVMYFATIKKVVIIS